MLALFLAVSCSLAIGMIFKHAGRQGMDRIALLTVNYAAALAVAVAFLAWGRRTAGAGLTPEVGLVALGVATGVLFIFGFFMLSLATDVAGMSLAIGVMRVSVVIPFLASWAIWNEVPTVAQGIGLVLAGAAFFMISRKERPEPEPHPAPAAEVASAAQKPPAAPPADQAASPAGASFRGETSRLYIFGVLALLFLAGGAVDVSMKAFDELFAAGNSRALFLLKVFGVAFAVGLAIVLWNGWRKGTWPKASTYRWGVVLGVVNYGSVEFILQAIEQLSGPFVFPANSVSIVIGGALLGVYFWGEHLSRLNWAGLGLAALALVLLNL